jgi:hypothetical protein
VCGCLKSSILSFNLVFSSFHSLADATPGLVGFLGSRFFPGISDLLGGTFGVTKRSSVAPAASSTTPRFAKS